MTMEFLGFKGTTIRRSWGDDDSSKDYIPFSGNERRVFRLSKFSFTCILGLGLCLSVTMLLCRNIKSGTDRNSLTIDPMWGKHRRQCKVHLIALADCSP